MDEKKLSIIIPTYNGSNKIPSLLKTLEEQTYKNFELVIVIDGSTDDTIEVISKFNDSFKEFKFITQENGGRSKARNSGAREAKGDWFIFIDDDIRLFPTIIEQFVTFQMDNFDSIYFGNPILDSLKAFNDDFNEYRMFIEEKWKERIRGNDQIRINLLNYCFTSQIFSISRDLFYSLEGFDERLTDSEDFDLSLKALQKEHSIYFNKDMIVYHDDYIGIEKYVTRQREYYESKRRLLEIHPEYETLLPAHFLWKKKSAMDRLKIMIMGHYEFWTKLFRSKLFSVIPRRARYYLYGLFTYVHSVICFKHDVDTQSITSKK